jgi:hydrogenase expression/formation protein HypD
MKIRKKYSACDAKIKYKNIIEKTKQQNPPKSTCLPDRQACRCGEILQGLIEPNQCPLFKKICAPENPFGACMVSIEGTCNIEYKYAR